MGEEVRLHTSLTQAIDGVKWTASRSGRFTPWKGPAVPNQQEAV